MGEGGIIIQKLSIHYKKEHYSQTLLKRSSAPPPNPPAGLVEPLLFVVVVAEGVMGEALVQPPKSSSAATVGVGLGAGAPQPLLMSLAVKVSGTFIMDAVDVVGAGAGAGVGSGLLQALPPQGSIIPAAAAVAAGTSGFAGCWGGGERTGGLEILNAELISCCGDDTVGLGGAAGARGGEERPKRSFESDDDGGLGLGCGGGDENPPNPRS